MRTNVWACCSRGQVAGTTREAAAEALNLRIYELDDEG
jgi:hypothetical protein